MIDANILIKFRKKNVLCDSLAFFLCSRIKYTFTILIFACKFKIKPAKYNNLINISTANSVKMNAMTKNK